MYSIHTYRYENKVICGTLKRCHTHTHTHKLRLRLTLTHLLSHPHATIIRNAHKKSPHNSNTSFEFAVAAAAGDDVDDDAGH